MNATCAFHYVTYTVPTWLSAPVSTTKTRDCYRGCTFPFILSPLGYASMMNLYLVSSSTQQLAEVLSLHNWYAPANLFSRNKTPWSKIAGRQLLLKMNAIATIKSEQAVATSQWLPYVQHKIVAVENFNELMPKNILA